MRKYIITSISDLNINYDFLDCLLNYCQKNKAKLILAPTKNFLKNYMYFHEDLDQYLLKNDKKLNDNLHILIRLNLNEGGDVTVGQINRGVSYIIPGTSHRLKILPRSLKSQKLPSIVCSIGSVNSRPTMYKSKNEFQKNHNHIVGALVVEIKNEKKFNIRQIEFDGQGFQDLNFYYSKKSAIKKRVEAVVMGDLHPGETCSKTLKATYRLFNLIKPKNIVLHDWFNGDSISHHLDNTPVSKSLHLRPLEDEIKEAAKLIGQIRDISKAKVHLVASNHPEHVERYLNEVRFKFDPLNIKCASKLFVDYVLSANIFLNAFKKYIKLKNIFFLEREDQLNICGFDCSNHGDHGPNGSRSAVNSINKDMIIGHTHSPQITKNGGTVVGTSTYLNLNYTNPSGLSSWLNTHAIIYPNGKRTLVNIIDGQF